MKRIIESQVEVTDEQLEDILSSALSGMTYWADDAYCPRTKNQPAPDLMLSETLTHGYKLKIHDAEEDKWRELTLTKFLKGLSLARMFDYDDYDSLDAERVVQLALFGKVIYA